MRVLHRAGERHLPGFSLSRYVRNLDWILLFAAVGLSVFGMAMIYSATHADPGLPSPSYFVTSQAQGFILGMVVLIAVSLVDYQHIGRWQRVLYVGTLLLLVATLLIGSGGEEVGAKRWIDLPFLRLQSSELAKVLLIVCLGSLLADGVELRHRFRFVLLAVGYVLVPALLVYLEPDLGTALVFGAILAAMLLVWGMRWLHLGILSAGLGVAVVFVLRVLPTTFGISVLKPYQLQRLTVFLDPEHDPTAAGYQLSQSKIAIASGMFSGKGFMHGTQTHLNFLPAHHTDFIFAVVGEELGFAGAALLLGLYALIIWRAFRIASTAKDLYGTLIASGIIAVLLFQVFLNIGMTIGILPVTGVPLPFVSFGSSSLVIFLMTVGLLESVHVHSRTQLYGGRPKGEPYGR